MLLIILAVQILLTVFFTLSVIDAVMVGGTLDFISYSIALGVTLWFLGGSLGSIMFL